MALPTMLQTPTKTIASYTKALKYLQRCLNNKSQCLLPETLCATQLLGIFEARDSFRLRALSRYALFDADFRTVLNQWRW